jgi:hypothetical protein
MDAIGTIERRLPSGRSLVLRAGPFQEEIEIRSQQGDIDLVITLTEAGPVVLLRSARLDVDSPEIALRCRRFSVSAAEEVRLEADEVRVQTEHDIHLNGAFVRLNCTPDAEPLPIGDGHAAGHPPCDDPACRHG